VRTLLALTEIAPMQHVVEAGEQREIASSSYIMRHCHREWSEPGQVRGDLESRAEVGQV